MGGREANQRHLNPYQFKKKKKPKRTDTCEGEELQEKEEKTPQKIKSPDRLLNTKKVEPRLNTGLQEGKIYGNWANPKQDDAGRRKGMSGGRSWGPQAAFPALRRAVPLKPQSEVIDELVGEKKACTRESRKVFAKL